MLERTPETKQKNIKRSEHLKEGVSPIMACAGTPEDFKYDGKINWLLENKPILYAHNVDYYGKVEDLEKSEIKNDKHGSGGYVISPIDSWDKYSRQYYDCTGLVMTGIDKITGKIVSFVSHQNPETFLSRGKTKFEEDLTKQIETMKERCEVGTIDASIIGGRYGKIKQYDSSDPKSDAFIEEYVSSIKFVSEIVKKIVGFEPSMIVTPKTHADEDMIFYDNDTKRLFIIRNKPDFGSDQNFSPSNLDEKRKNWKPGEWTLPE